MISVSTYSCCGRKRKSYDAINNTISTIDDIQIEIERQQYLHDFDIQMEIGRGLLRHKQYHRDLDIQMEIERHLLRHKQYHHPDWAHMDADLLEYIQRKLPLSDILRCRAVCRWWRSVTKTHLSLSMDSIPKPSPPQIIWNKYFTADAYWWFLDVLRGNFYQPDNRSKQLLGMTAHCVGYSSDGGYFLLRDREKMGTLYLFQPMLFSGTALRLPLISGPAPSPAGAVSVDKAVLWGDPISDSSYGLVVLSPDDHRPPLFAKCGATQFTQLECRDDDGDDDDDDDEEEEYLECRDPDDAADDYVTFDDIICVKNRIYGITELRSHYFNVWDCTTCIGSNSSDVPRLELEFKPKFSTTHPPSGISHLVESQGEILLVMIDCPDNRRIEAKGLTITEYNKLWPMCKVYKMDFNKKEWVHMNSLGDRVLFVVDEQSFSLSSHEFPQYQRNSIYYKHNLRIRERRHSLGIFNMEDGSLKLIDAEKG